MEPQEIELVKVENVSKRFKLRSENSLKESLVNFFTGKKNSHIFDALTDINLSVPAGTTLGLIGHNGSGKSTLLKIIGGILEPSRGKVEKRGSLAALLELGAGFHPDLTGRENVYLNAAILGLTKTQVDQKFDDILEFSGIGDFIDTQVKFYSSGMYVRIAFAVAVNVDPDILLVDEVLAVGDELFQQKCMDKIREFQRDGRTIIIVSHSAEQVLSLCDSVMLLERGVSTYYGEPREGIRRLRKSLAERESGQTLEDNPPVLIENLSVRAMSSSGRQKVTFSSDSSFVLEADYRLSEKFDGDLRMEMRLIGESGSAFVCSDSAHDSMRLPSQEGHCTVGFSIQDASKLPVGVYSVEVKIIDADSKVLGERRATDCFSLTAHSDQELRRPSIDGEFTVGIRE